jgi:hypothetical protein
MRGIRIAVVVALGLPVAGCFSVTLPPKELPEWAMNPQAAEAVSAPRPTKAARRVKPKGTPDQTATVSYVTGDTREQSTRATRPADVKPFSAEWQAREDAADNRLRRSMSICGGC